MLTGLKNNNRKGKKQHSQVLIYTRAKQVKLTIMQSLSKPTVCKIRQPAKTDWLTETVKHNNVIKLYSCRFILVKKNLKS